jgi:isoleucyl-tRNA synthetase
MLELTAIILAPFTPFLSEELYQKITMKDESVHLMRWPAPLEGRRLGTGLEDMARTRQIITDALALRMQKSDTEEQIKVRQPLSKLVYPGNKLDDFYEQIIMDEVNVKIVENGKELMLNKTLTPELKREGFARDLIRAIQSARKNARLSMDDHIKLSLSIDLPMGFEALVKSETLTDDFAKNANYSHDEIAKVNGENITISLEKI